MQSLPGRVYKDVSDMLQRQQHRLTLLPLVRLYDQRKLDLEAMDFGDQMARAARVARDHPEVGAIERGRFKVVLLDEYQDTSHAQVVMLNALFGGGHPVTAVGDPCQSIYGWRGASAGTLDRFPAEFTGPGGRDAWVLNLTKSWRNRPEILDVANALSRPLRAAGARVAELVPAQRVAEHVGGRTVACALLPTYADEAAWIADSMLTAWRLSARMPDTPAARDPAGEASDQRGAGPGTQPDPGPGGGAAVARSAGRGGRPGRPAGHPGGTRRRLHAAGARRPDRRRGPAAAAHRRPLADRAA